MLSPVDLAALEPSRPSGAVLAWRWVRLLTPFINLYAVFFLIGGAIRSAWRHYRYRGHMYRAAGNALIAFGAILPGIGGSFAKAGMVEVLYVGECIGIILIWLATGSARWQTHGMPGPAEACTAEPSAPSVPRHKPIDLVTPCPSGSGPSSRS